MFGDPAGNMEQLKANRPNRHRLFFLREGPVFPQVDEVVSKKADRQTRLFCQKSMTVGFACTEAAFYFFGEIFHIAAFLIEVKKTFRPEVLANSLRQIENH